MRRTQNFIIARSIQFMCIYRFNSWEEGERSFNQYKWFRFSIYYIEKECAIPLYHCVMYSVIRVIFHRKVWFEQMIIIFSFLNHCQDKSGTSLVSCFFNQIEFIFAPSKIHFFSRFVSFCLNLRLSYSRFFSRSLSFFRSV